MCINMEQYDSYVSAIVPLGHLAWPLSVKLHHSPFLQLPSAPTLLFLFFIPLIISEHRLHSHVLFVCFLNRI